MAKRKIDMTPHIVENKKTGNVRFLLNPAQKGTKYAVELKHGKALTNNLKRKTTKNGSQKVLTEKQKAYRAGYLDARKDNARCFKAKKKRQSQARKKNK